MDGEIKSDHDERNNLLIISGSCCSPNMNLLDQQVQRIIQQALEETGVDALVKVITISTVVQGALPEKIMQELRPYMQPSTLSKLPAMLINGKLQFWGIPNLEKLKTILINIKEGTK